MFLSVDVGDLLYTILNAGFDRKYAKIFMRACQCSFPGFDMNCAHLLVAKHMSGLAVMEM
jgi:hypothetical protein